MKATKNDINKEYNPRLSVSNYEALLAKSKNKASKALKSLNGHTNFKYGIGKLQTLDVFYKKTLTKMPVHIFIHGGYWRALDKGYHTHMALPFYNSNIVFFNLNYDLCPFVTLSDIKNQIIEAIVWIIKNGKKFNADVNNIVLSGHSAGAHLVSLLISHNWKDNNINVNIFKGAGLISGIYDTELVLNLEINKEINLSDSEALKNNTLKMTPIVKMPIILAYGDQEPKKWIQQTTNYRAWLKKNQYNTTLIKCNNSNHFSLIDSLAKKNNKIIEKLISYSK